MDKPENKIDLEASVSEQIADMQLMYLRQMAFNRVLTYDEIKTLEILTKVKNVEIEKRQPKEEDPKKLKARKLEQLANSISQEVLEGPKDDKANDPVSKH